MRLFISYASEDREAFAEPLAEVLGEQFEVWFAPYELKVGDSLLQKISEGLRNCDYGIVVLSEHFFAKKWPTNELNGLFALEEPARKVILPVWRNISEERVKAFSPILADRFAANANEGVTAVAAALRLAIDASARQRRVGAVDVAVEKLKTLSARLKQQREATALLESEHGANLVSAAAVQMYDVIEQAFSGLSGASGGLQYRVNRRGNQGVVVDANYRLALHSYLRNGYVNTAASAVFTVLVTRAKDDFPERDWEILEKTEFEPWFDEGSSVVWLQRGDDEKRQLASDQLAAFALERLQHRLEQMAAR